MLLLPLLIMLLLLPLLILLLPLFNMKDRGSSSTSKGGIPLLIMLLLPLSSFVMLLLSLLIIRLPNHLLEIFIKI